MNNIRIFRSTTCNGSKRWRSGGSARLPPMWPGFKSRRRRHMWVEFVVGSLLCSERFFSGYSGFPLSSETSISKFQFDQESGRRRTTLWMSYLQIIIYLFIYLFNGIYGEAPPERGIFFRLQVYEREWIFVVFERVGKCVISVCKKAQKCLQMYFMAVTSL